MKRIVFIYLLFICNISTFAQGWVTDDAVKDSSGGVFTGILGVLLLLCLIWVMGYVMDRFNEDRDIREKRKERKESTFDEETYKNATLYVPKDSKNLYWIHPYWENFFKKEEIDLSGISPTISEDSSQKEGVVYNLNGERMAVNADNINGLPKGIYIVNRKKLMVK